MAVEFRSGPRLELVVRCRTAKVSLETQESFSCGATSTKMKLVQLRRNKSAPIISAVPKVARARLRITLPSKD